MDVFSLELAIYFVLPPLLIFVAAYMSADIFVMVAGITVEREIKRDTGVTAMAILIIATAIAAFFTYWTTQRSASAFLAGFAAYFIAGGFTYARLVNDYSERGTKHRFTPIGLKRGFVLSALLSVCTVAPVTIFAWFVFRG